jgi:uncharacterized repeat protein (TIGR03843 family)
MDTAVTLSLLQLGSMEIEGLLPWSSNYSFLVRICPNTAVQEAITTSQANQLEEIRAVYKPRRGERPLWDFPQGTLYQRERAAFVVSQALGWNQVPPTIIRKGSHGIGSVQLFIDHDPEIHYFAMEGNHTFSRQLQKIALLDIIINNADRKAGHVLLEECEHSPDSDRLWIIDHGICFHTENKLRTVIWEFAGLPIPPPLLEEVTNFTQSLATPATTLYREMSDLLSARELKALQQRTRRILDQKIFTVPGPGRHYPWPPV